MSMESWNENNPKTRTAYSTEEREIMTFLEGAEAKYGKHSAAFIRCASFPSVEPSLIPHEIA